MTARTPSMHGEEMYEAVDWLYELTAGTSQLRERVEVCQAAIREAQIQRDREQGNGEGGRERAGRRELEGDREMRVKVEKEDKEHKDKEQKKDREQDTIVLESGLSVHDSGLSVHESGLSVHESGLSEDNKEMDPGMKLPAKGNQNIQWKEESEGHTETQSVSSANKSMHIQTITDKGGLESNSLAQKNNGDKVLIVTDMRNADLLDTS